MRRIVYYVATSLDGYIAGPNNNIEGFVEGGNGVEKYLNDLKSFDTVIMGKNTYEFGYQYGLQPGQLAYPHMNHFIFSSTLTFEKQDSKLQIKNLAIKEIEAIRKQPGSDIYLCGGGQFAGWLLNHQQIDLLKIKLNPFISGQGIKLFENASKRYKLEVLDSANYDYGLQINTYKIIYSPSTT